MATKPKTSEKNEDSKEVENINQDVQTHVNETDSDTTLNASGDEGDEGNDDDEDEGNQDGTRSEETQSDEPDAEAKRETLLATEFTMNGFEGETFGEIGQFIWDNIPGEKWDDRFDNMQSLITAMRVARDASKPKSTREVKSMSDVVRESIGKPMSELQAIKVKVVAGVNLPIPAVVKLAENKASPLYGYANEWMEKNNVKVVSEKKGSRGKASLFLRRRDYVVPGETDEGNDEAPQGASESQPEGQAAA